MGMYVLCGAAAACPPSNAAIGTAATRAPCTHATRGWWAPGAACRRSLRPTVLAQQRGLGRTAALRQARRRHRPRAPAQHLLLPGGGLLQHLLRHSPAGA